MKNNKLLILLVGLASISIISYIGDYIYYKVPSFNDTIINSEVESENTLNIYLYDSKTKEYNIEEIKNRSSSIDEGDYVDAIINNMKLEPSSYKFLAAYNIKRNSKNTVIIKLSRSFNKLQKSKLNDFVNSVKKTIIENFDGIEDIIIEVDSN